MKLQYTVYVMRLFLRQFVVCVRDVNDDDDDWCLL